MPADALAVSGRGGLESTTVSYARISVCGVVEYPCHGTCNDYIREHEAIWIADDGRVNVTGGYPYCPACAAERQQATPPIETTPAA